MRKEKNLRVLFALLLAIGTITPALAADSRDSYTAASLAEVLDIEKIIVNSVEYNPGSPGDFLSNMIKESVTPISATENLVSMTPVQVRIQTNRTLPIRVETEFTQLRHIATSTLIPTANLSVSPTSEDIPNPYNGVLTGGFTPSAIITTGTLTGAYEGTLVFTLTAQ